MKKLPFFFYSLILLFFIFINPLQAEYYSGNTKNSARIIRVPIWVFLEGQPGTMQEDEGSTFLPPKEALQELSLFLLSGMSYGWYFNYTPQDNKRKVDEVFQIEPINGIEIRKKAYAIGIKENKEIEWFEAVYEWSERHLWTFSGLEMIYPDVMFRRIENNIEISWDSRNKYKDNKNYKIEFTNLKGRFFVNMEKFEKEVLSFIDRVERITEIISKKMKSVFNGKYIDSSYLYKRVSEDSLQRNFLEEINKSGYNFNSIYDLMLLDEKDKNIVPVFLKYLKLFELDIKKHLVRFLGVKGFVSASKFLLEEFHKTKDFIYRFTIANTLSLIQDENILEDLIEIIGNRMYGEARIPIIYRLYKFKNFQLEKVLMKLLNDKEVSEVAEYSLNELKKI